ncbi:hypothetical protein CENSYa_0918 [Cenarchaeum symbiosum A]|uniref:Uncharacterized protein n=1 Tax=Cenarchaeum symbiosum (strain A) TaxID=414004 RepID=A0RW33_CENSY|nr:hypothetical protein CENSYa_0918 [Cenarchaeum symbiosum A]
MTCHAFSISEKQTRSLYDDHRPSGPEFGFGHGEKSPRRDPCLKSGFEGPGGKLTPARHMCGPRVQAAAGPFCTMLYTAGCPCGASAEAHAGYMRRPPMQASAAPQPIQAAAAGTALFCAAARGIPGGSTSLEQDPPGAGGRGFFFRAAPASLHPESEQVGGL